MLYFIDVGVGTCLKFASNGDVTGYMPIMLVPVCVKPVGFTSGKVTISNWYVFGGTQILRYSPRTRRTYHVYANPIVITGNVCKAYEEKFREIEYNPFSNVIVKEFVECEKCVIYVYSLCCSELEYYNTIKVLQKGCFVRVKPYLDAMKLVEKKFVEVVRPGITGDSIVSDAYKLTEITHKLASRISRDLYSRVIVQIGLDGIVRVYVPLSQINQIDNVVNIIDVIYDVDKTDIFLVSDVYIEQAFKFVSKREIKG